MTKPVQPLILKTVRVFPALLAAVAVLAAAGFMMPGDRRPPAELRLPEAEPPPPALRPVADSTLSRPEHRAFDTPVPDLEGRWPGFRGPNRDGVAPDSPRLARQWPEGGPPVRWSIDVGEGYAGAAIWDGRVYIIDYDAENRADVVRCLSLDTGRDIWQYAYPVVVRRQHGMSRTIPAVDGQYVVTLGPKCHVTCLDSETGQYRWSIDLVERYGTTVPQWYAGQCPLIDGGRAIIAPGGSSLMIAVDLETGDIVWETPNPRRFAMSHASILPLTVDGRPIYVYAAHGGAAAVDAATGLLLWETTQWRVRMATVPTAVDAGGGRVFFSGGYNAGSLMVRLAFDGDFLRAETLFQLGPSEFGSDQQTPVLYRGAFYGVTPEAQGAQLACFDTDGNRLWASGYDHAFGLGPYMIADGLLFILNDYGRLSMIDSAADGYNVLDSAQVVPDGYETWGPPAFAGGLMIVRDLRRMICLDLREN